jgi:hypothetical protein
VGANALRSLLLDSPLKERWEVVIYIANPRSNFTEQDKERDTMRSRRREPEESQQVIREDNEWKDRLLCLAKHDLRQFLRCGFKQATDSVQKTCGLYVFAVPDFLDCPMLSHQQAMAGNIVDRKQLSPSTTMSDEESKLLRFMVTACSKRGYFREVMVQNQAHPPATTTAGPATTYTKLARHDAEVKAEIGRLVGASKDGASAAIKNSNSLHACAAQMTPEYIDLLLEFVPRAEHHSLLNMFDSDGSTPLMVVASQSRFSDKPELRFRTAERLLELGADKNIADASGETALGRYRDMKRAMTDLQDPCDVEEDQEKVAREHALMERLLWPLDGPTAADDACLDEDEDDDDDEEDDDDDEEDDDSDIELDEDDEDWDDDGDEEDEGEEE